METDVHFGYATRGGMLASAWKWGPYPNATPLIALRPDIAEALRVKTA